MTVPYIMFKTLTKASVAEHPRYWTPWRGTPRFCHPTTDFIIVTDRRPRLAEEGRWATLQDIDLANGVLKEAPVAMQQGQLR